MNWITPLGFLGFAGIAVLILIYLLKPNYQQKIVSSTYVWKLSLKYRKKKIPVSRFRNLLILLCQILIITACALILAQPVIRAEKPEEHAERILILDASGNMRASYEGKTRFERAVERASALAEEILEGDGYISVILSSESPDFVVRRAYGAEAVPEVTAQLSALVDESGYGNYEAWEEGLHCGYGTGNIDEAMNLAALVREENPEARVIYYTATDYIDDGSVTVESVRVEPEGDEEGEWNAAVLGCSAEIVENYYQFTVRVACYGRAREIPFTCEIYVNNRPIRISRSVRVRDGRTENVVIRAQDIQPAVTAYDYVYVKLDVDDSFSYDDEYYLYGGTKETIRVQYFSPDPNIFFRGIFMAMQDEMRGKWNVEFKQEQDTYSTEGYDLYVFEHRLPDNLPKDGVVLLVDPNETDNPRAPEGAGLVFGSQVVAPSGVRFPLAAGETHPVTKFVAAEEMIVSSYRKIEMYDGYLPLLYCRDDPVLLIRNEVDSKVAVFAFGHDRADYAISYFPYIIVNMFDYFFPSTVEKNAFEVDETVELNARGETLKVQSAGTGFAGMSAEFTQFPAELKLSRPGTYTLSQKLISGREAAESVFVTVPALESNILRTEDVLPGLPDQSQQAEEDKDLVVWFAAALVALLFAEWWLQSRDRF